DPALPRTSEPAGSSTVMSAVPDANGRTYCFHVPGKEIVTAAPSLSTRTASAARTLLDLPGSVGRTVTTTSSRSPATTCRWAKGTSTATATGCGAGNVGMTKLQEWCRGGVRWVREAGAVTGVSAPSR